MKRRGQIVLANRLVGLWRPPEQLQRLGLWGGGEGYVGDALVTGAGRHLGRQQVFGADLATILQLGKLLGGQHLLELRGGLAGLRGMCLVRDHREPLALGRRELAYLFEREGEGLNGADNDLFARRERLGELSALARTFRFDGGNDAGGALEVEQRVLKLGIDHVPVGEEMRGPRNRVGLARASRVLDEKLAACPLLQHPGLQLPGGVELMIAREDDTTDLLLVVAAGHQVATYDLQPAISAPDFLP